MGLSMRGLDKKLLRETRNFDTSKFEIRGVK
jgi:hypothetical protein